MQSTTRAIVLIAGLIVCAYSATALGSDNVSFDASLGVFYTDNLGRVNTNEESQAVTEGQVGVNAKLETNNSKIDLIGRLRHRNYGSSSFADETLGYFDGQGTVDIVPNRVTWFASDNFGQRTQNPFSSDRPGNRENINVFLTGPDFYVLSGGRDQLRLSGRYGDVNFENSPRDYEKLTGGLHWEHALPNARSFGFSLETDRVEFSADSGGSNYDVQRAFAHFSSATSLSTLNISIGANQLHDRFITEGSLSSKLAYQRKLAKARVLAISVSRELSDSGLAFAQRQSGNYIADISDDIFASDDPFVRSLISVAVSSDNNEASKSRFRLFFDDRSYVSQSALDREEYGVDFVYQRSFSPLLTGNFEGRLSRRDFQSQTDDEIRLSAGVTRRMSRWLSAEFVMRHWNRESSAANGDYSENRAEFRLVGNW